MTTEQIESIEFFPIGMEQPYTLKKVEVNHPLQNVSGYIRIGLDYFERVVIPAHSFAAVQGTTYNRPRRSIFGTGNPILDILGY